MSSPKVRLAGLRAGLHVFKSLSWRLCDRGSYLLNHCKNKLPGSCLLVSAFTPSLPEQGGAACPSVIAVGLEASPGKGSWLPPCPSLFLYLLSLLKTVCSPPEKKEEQHRVITGCSYGGRLRGVKGGSG